MSKPTVQHDTLVIERRYPASRARVFAAWSDPEARPRWQVPNEAWEVGEVQYDFRVGGLETGSFGPKGDPRYRSESHYLHIVDGQRIVMAGNMFDRETALSSSMATVELLADGDGTRMIYTEQGAFFDGKDSGEARKKGWETNFAKLEKELSRKG